ncbi:TIGR02757 family protein [Nitratifractor sp.]
MNRQKLKKLLDREAARRNDPAELSPERPDPLLVASVYREERIALICALFGYGSARQIVAFLKRLDFSLLDAASQECIVRELRGLKYRFQTPKDTAALFIALHRLGRERSLGKIVREAYEERREIRDGLWALIRAIREAHPYGSRGYDFLVGKVPENPERCAPFKRYMMYFRWMVRRDALDMGLWEGIDPADLIVPLDTHTHAVSLRLGLLKRKSYDMKAALELTETLRRFDPADPVKYDFALYRIGQEEILDKFR